MELLDRYLADVGTHLPRAQRADVVKELAANIREQIEDTEAGLGRPLGDAEVQAILRRHGEPMEVAARFRPESRSLTLGRRLIGPELFPLYLMLLRINLGITLALFAFIAVLGIARGEPLPRVAGRTLGGAWLPVLVQVIAVTLVFVAWDLWRTRRRREWSVRTWSAPVPRRMSAVGLAVFTVLAAWWAALPISPALLLGSAADGLALSSGWRAFHLPVLALLLAGVAQRAINLLRPDRAWLVPATRLATNGLGLVMLYVVARSYPLVVATGDAGEHHQQLARWLNAPTLLWWLWPYLLINFAAHAAVCARWLRLRRGREGASAEPGTSPS